LSGPECLELMCLAAHIAPDAQREIDNLQLSKLKFMESGRMRPTGSYPIIQFKSIELLGQVTKSRIPDGMFSASRAGRTGWPGRAANTRYCSESNIGNWRIPMSFAGCVYRLPANRVIYLPPQELKSRKASRKRSRRQPDDTRCYQMLPDVTASRIRDVVRGVASATYNHFCRAQLHLRFWCRAKFDKIVATWSR
jgi:hypothetical protein